ncbi:MAG: L-seryl-tRNA(Sec) selenium transferase [Treponemataceae bacterium]
METIDRRSLIPQVERLLSRDDISAFAERLSRPLVVQAVSSALEGLRRRVVEDEYYVPTEADAASVCVASLERLDRKRLRKVLNATGVVLHTNMGRSPVAQAAWAGAEELNVGYSNLEFDLEQGTRGRRGGIASELFSILTGAEAALIVNNNAAAVLLCLVALCAGKEVIVSRGEAVQIGGGFRIPDILALSGARLKEVGTTNVTTIDDYVRAIGPNTAAVLLVHASNFALRGFAKKPDPRALFQALPVGIPVIVDQGSGCTVERVGGEEPVARSLRAGARLACFSADKVLGGPQAGIIVGDAALIARLSKHPFMRVFRPGKTVLSLLETTLIERLGKGEAHGSAPSAVERALDRTEGDSLQDLKAFGRRIVKRLPKEKASIESSRAALGGGSSPDEFVDSWAIELVPAGSAEALKRELRLGRVPIICRIEKNRVLLDLLTLADEDPKLVAELVEGALEREAASGPENSSTAENLTET